MTRTASPVPPSLEMGCGPAVVFGPPWMTNTSKKSLLPTWNENGPISSPTASPVVLSESSYMT